jgi:hypothetical protein
MLENNINHILKSHLTDAQKDPTYDTGATG